MTTADAHSNSSSVPPPGQGEPHDQEQAGHGEHPHVSLRTYTFVFIALMALLFLTVGAAFIHFGHHSINVIVALLIAIIKAALVVLFFMHVRYASRLTQIFVLAGLLWLGIMFVLTFSDYNTRAWLPMSRGWVNNPVKQETDAGSAAAPAHSAPAEGAATH